MTWFTRASNKIVGEDYDSKCGHLEVGDKAHMCSMEHDGLGSPAKYYFCESCWEKAVAEGDEEEEACHDCRQIFKMKDLTSWRWYDFHAPQGDEPLLICNTCRTQETHLERVRKDKEAYQTEMDHFDDMDERDYW